MARVRKTTEPAIPAAEHIKSLQARLQGISQECMSLRDEQEKAEAKIEELTDSLSTMNALRHTAEKIAEERGKFMDMHKRDADEARFILTSRDLEIARLRGVLQALGREELCSAHTAVCGVWETSHTGRPAGGAAGRGWE